MNKKAAGEYLLAFLYTGLIVWMMIGMYGCASVPKKPNRVTPEEIYAYRYGYLQGLLSAVDGKDRMMDYPNKEK